MINNSFINYELLKSFEAKSFIYNQPFPWYNFKQFLTLEGFQQLLQDFPSLELFEKHQGLERVYGQRPHDRYYLAYQTSIYRQVEHQDRGIINDQDLPTSWQMFVHELETSRIYQNFIKSLFEVADFQIRYAWHIGVTNSEVSPHTDAEQKIGTHIFYFNTSDDWETTWSGSTLVLGNKLKDVMNPDFSDFTTAIPTQFTDNHSFLFKNTPDAWHGVKPLSCPKDKYRRLFNVIFEFRQTNNPLSLPKKLLQKTLSGFRLNSLN
ncbi:MAG: 2OG-Fe(II) oxygenase [Pleurocapsa sp.]